MRKCAGFFLFFFLYFLLAACMQCKHDGNCLAVGCMKGDGCYAMHVLCAPAPCISWQHSYNILLVKKVFWLKLMLNVRTHLPPFLNNNSPHTTPSTAASRHTLPPTHLFLSTECQPLLETCTTTHFLSIHILLWDLTRTNIAANIHPFFLRLTIIHGTHPSCCSCGSTYVCVPVSSVSLHASRTKLSTLRRIIIHVRAAHLEGNWKGKAQLYDNWAFLSIFSLIPIFLRILPDPGY